MAKRILSVLRELGLEMVPPCPEYPRIGQIGAIAHHGSCDICFLDVATDPEHAQLLIGELAPAISVVAMHTRAEAELILRCLRRGACEFLTDPTADALRSLFARLNRMRGTAVERELGQVYVVTPGKVGSGASTVAAHLAIRFAAGGGRVLLVDGDTLYASISFLLKLKAEYHLGDVLRDWKRMDDDLWRRFTIRTCGIDVLAAPANPASRIEIHPQLAVEICGFWRERYDLVVLDMADARTASDTGFAALADQVFLVSANELGALQATRRSVEYLEQGLAGRERMRLILNRCTALAGLKREDVMGALGVEPYAILGHDWATLQAALLEGRPAPAASRFGTGLEAFYRQLRSDTREETPKPAGKKNGTWLSLLRHRNKAEAGRK